MITDSRHQSAARPASVAEQAADWFARLSGDHASNADWRRFWKWRDADSAHALAYDRLSQEWQALQVFADDPAIVEMRLKALAERPAPRNHWLMAVAATVLAALLTSAVLLLPQWGADDGGQRLASQNEASAPASPKVVEIAKAVPETPPSPAAFRSQFRTGMGEQSKFTLPDGSVIELNTDSQVEVDFSGGVRNLMLARGEAVFRVAHDSKRPFVVGVANNRVIALGTVFSVRQDSQESIITLLEGKVRIERVEAGVATEAAQLSPGEQLKTAAAAPFQIRKVDSDRVASWRSGRLEFKNEPLGDAIKEINRYSNQKILIESSDLAALRINGTFRIQSSDQFAKAQESALPIKVERQGATGDLVLTRKPAKKAASASQQAAESDPPKKN